MGTSLFFIDAVLTIIISSVSASDVTLLIFPELAPWRILLAEIYAFFIMAVLTAVGPRRAVPLFLIGGGAFTLFTILALSWVALQAVTQPGLANAVPAIVGGLEASGVVTHVVEAGGEVSSLSTALFFQFFLRSMSSAMLGFSGYEVIPASGKHAARPKWKVINTALIVAAIFLICTGIIQLFAATTWRIPATEGYSTLLIQYELVFGSGTTLLWVAGILLAFILLLAQGGGYVGGAAVAANAARLGRLPRPFEDDRVGVVVIWAVAAILIPVIRTVTTVESFYAFGFVSEFVIVSTTIYFVGDDVLKKRGIMPGSPQAKALRFAGLRGMVASYAMLAVLITQKTAALPPILLGAGLIVLFQIFIHRGGLRRLLSISLTRKFAFRSCPAGFASTAADASAPATRRGSMASPEPLNGSSAAARWSSSTSSRCASAASSATRTMCCRRPGNWPRRPISTGSASRSPARSWRIVTSPPGTIAKSCWRPLNISHTTASSPSWTSTVTTGPAPAATTPACSAP